MHILLGLFFIFVGVAELFYGNSKNKNPSELNKTLTLIVGVLFIIGGIGTLFNPHFKLF